MKEKHIKVTESMAAIFSRLDNKKAGELMKATISYAFDGVEYKGKDALLQSYFTYIKRMIDQYNYAREVGKIGGQISAELYKLNGGNKPVKKIIKKVTTTDFVTEGYEKEVITIVEKPSGNTPSSSTKILSKSQKTEAGKGNSKNPLDMLFRLGQSGNPISEESDGKKDKRR